MSVPKAAMDEDRLAPPEEGYVGGARNIAPVEAIAIT
jgi:hypothetical protein